MLEGLAYTAEENLRRIAMDSITKYVLVEGEDDVPLYDNSLQNLLKKDKCDYVILHGGGKSSIIDFIDMNEIKNTFIIFDRDFDYDFSCKHKDHIILDKYSIENYLFDVDVIAPCLAIVLKERIAEIERTFPLTKWVSDINTKLKNLFTLLFYYQKKYKGNKEGWNKLFLLDYGSDKWELSTTIIKSAIHKILSTTAIKMNTARKYLSRKKVNIDKVNDLFPGKMIFESFYRFSFVYSEQIKERRFKGNYTNSDAYKNAISLSLSKSSSYVSKMQPVVAFASS